MADTLFRLARATRVLRLSAVSGWLHRHGMRQLALARLRPDE